MKEYEVEVNGVVTRLLLSDADAKARGLLADKAKEPPNKAHKPANKAAQKD